MIRTDAVPVAFRTVRTAPTAAGNPPKPGPNAGPWIAVPSMIATPGSDPSAAHAPAGLPYAGSKDWNSNSGADHSAGTPRRVVFLTLPDGNPICARATDRARTTDTFPRPG